MVTAGLEAMMNRQYNNQGEKWTALYVRLSRDDENEGDSNSIQHQIEILTKYCKDHAIFLYFQKLRYLTSAFKRPGFLDMIGDIEAGLVNMVIVKDMSRFGRNYLEVGLYTEIRFPEMGVRFIAVNDGVDSDDQMGNDFTPFRNIINEWYAKDTSKKIRAVFRNKGMSGQRLAVNAPYGYIKGEDGHLLVDEETAPVVELIFQLCVEGNGPGKIARMLKEREIPTPGTITFQRTGQTSRYFPDDPCRWNPATVLSILGQDAYLGRTTNFKTTKLSYKSKKTVINSPDKWAVFEGTHEAIIDKETWEIVQKSREHRRRPTKMGEMGLFSGLAYCADCGAKLYHHRSITLTKEQESYICSNYQSRKKCTAHYIRAVVLEQLVLQNLQRVVAYAQEDENEFVRRVMENKTAVQRAEQEQAKRKLEKQERRISELDRIIQQLYEDRVSGALSAERFAKLSGGYEKEQEELKQSAKELQAIVNTIETQAVNVQSFLKIVRKYTAPTELTPALLREFVEKIVVHAPDKSSGHRTQRIDVHYNFIGEIDFSPEYSQVSRQTTA